MIKCRVFLFKISHEPMKDKIARLNVSTNFQRRVLLRVLRQISKGQIPISKDTYLTLKAKKKKSLLVRFSDKDYFKNELKGSKIAQISTLKKFLVVLQILFKPIFYNGV